MSTPLITIKRGDTCRLVCAVTIDGDPADITGWSIRSYVRRGKTLVGELTATITDAANGAFTLLEKVAGMTEEWTPGSHTMDIEYTNASNVIFSTETIDVTVIPDITYDD